MSPGRCVASRQYPPAASTRCTTSSTNNTRITLFIIWKAANFRHIIKAIYRCSTLPSPVQSNASDCKARAALDTYLHFPFKIIHERRYSAICALCALSRPYSLNNISTLCRAPNIHHPSVYTLSYSMKLIKTIWSKKSGPSVSWVICWLHMSFLWCYFSHCLLRYSALISSTCIGSCLQ